MGFEDHSRPHPTMTFHILLLLLASSVLGDPDSVGRQPRHRRRLCSLGTCQTHRLPEMMYWLRSLHQGALGEGGPRAPGPPQLRAPPAARGQGPAPSPGPWPEEKRPAQCPASWVTSGTSLPSPGLSLPICVLGPRPQVSFPLTPSPGLTQKLSPPAVIWAGPRGTPDPACTKNTNVQSLIKRVSCFRLCLSVPIPASQSEPSL
uniref:LOW QUALITY PROTEIN: putative adrenomedullin-5-like protein n=1 Tax=Halichoerus grypus TaxID=9711 RepID=UPI00165977CE|nr:LOW QUALITY PROTEIN: putative adrenomedullin-5-like protein [Halichoerus grypus]